MALIKNISGSFEANLSLLSYRKSTRKPTVKTVGWIADNLK